MIAVLLGEESSRALGEDVEVDSISFFITQ